MLENVKTGILTTGNSFLNELRAGIVYWELLTEILRVPLPWVGVCGKYFSHLSAIFHPKNNLLTKKYWILLNENENNNHNTSHGFSKAMNYPVLAVVRRVYQKDGSELLGPLETSARALNWMIRLYWRVQIHDPLTVNTRLIKTHGLRQSFWL